MEKRAYYHIAEILMVHTGVFLMPPAGAVGPEGIVVDHKSPIDGFAEMFCYMSGEDLYFSQDIGRGFNAMNPLMAKQLAFLEGFSFRPKTEFSTRESYVDYLNQTVSEVGEQYGFWHKLEPMSIWQEEHPLEVLNKLCPRAEIIGIDPPM